MPDFIWYEMPGNPVNEWFDTNSQSQKCVATLDVDAQGYEAGTVICEFTDLETDGRGVIRRFFTRRPGAVAFEFLCEWFPDPQQTGPYGAKLTTMSFVVSDGVIHAVAEVQIGEPPDDFRLYYGQYDLKIPSPEWSNTLLDEHPDGHGSPDIALNPSASVDLRLVVLYIKHVSANRWDLKKVVSTNGSIWFEISSEWIDTTQMPADIIGVKPQLLFLTDLNTVVHFNGAFYGSEYSATLCHCVWNAPLNENTSVGEIQIYTPQMCLTSYQDVSGVGMLGYRENENPKFAYWYPTTGISEIETVDSSAYQSQFKTKQYALACRDDIFHALYYKDSENYVVHRKRSVIPEMEWEDGDPFYCGDEWGYPIGAVLNCLNAEKTPPPECILDTSHFGLVALRTDIGPNYNLFCRSVDDPTSPGGGGLGAGCYLQGIYLIGASSFDMSLKTGAISKRIGAEPIKVMDWTTLSDDTIIFVSGTEFKKFDYATPSYWPLEWKTFKFPDATWQCLKWLRVIGDIEEDFQLIIYNDETSPLAKTILIKTSDSGVIKPVNLNGRRFYFELFDPSNSANIIDEIEICVVQTKPSK